MIDHKACPCDPEIVRLLEDAARGQGVPTLTMASGAGHDAQQMAAIARSAMIFVRSKDGRSHTPDEFSSIEDIVDGIRVLAAGPARARLLIFGRGRDGKAGPSNHLERQAGERALPRGTGSALGY